MVGLALWLSQTFPLKWNSLTLGSLRILWVGMSLPQSLPPRLEGSLWQLDHGQQQKLSGEPGRDGQAGPHVGIHTERRCTVCVRGDTSIRDSGSLAPGWHIRRDPSLEPLFHTVSSLSGHRSNLWSLGVSQMVVHAVLEDLREREPM